MRIITYPQVTIHSLQNSVNIAHVLLIQFSYLRRNKSAICLYVNEKTANGS